MLGLLEFFDPLAVPAQDSNTLPTASNSESDHSTHAYAILQQDTADPGSVGRVTILHGVKIFPTCVKVPSTQWHGQIFTFVHDSLSCNDPQSMEFPADAFSVASGPGGMATFCPKAVQLMFAAIPALEMVDPPGLMDPCHQLVGT
jgi:hypothetical protein